MPFIGNQPALSYTSFAKQDFTTSATTSYTLDHPVTNENEIALFINFVRQEPTTAYTASGTSLTLTSATSASDDMYCVFLGKAVQTVNPPSGSVGLSQLSATGTKDSTTFLRGDNTFAVAGGDNTPAFQAYRTANQTLGGNNTFTKVQFTAENFDTDNLYDNSTNYRFTPNTSDKYMIYSHVQIGATGIDRNGISEIAIYKNGSSIAVSIIDSRQASSLGGHRFTCTINYVVEPNGSTDYYEIYARCFDNSGLTPELVHDTNGSIVFGAYKLIGV